jgi:osmotically-inducible protein OsmY
MNFPAAYPISTIFLKSIEEALTITGFSPFPRNQSPPLTIVGMIDQAKEAAMAVEPRDVSETAREEDYRDYEERDLDEGWPYADADGNRGRKRNAAYDQSQANFDSEENPGVEIAGQTAIVSEGGPALSKGIAHDAIDDDALEEEISDRLSLDDRIDESQITITVHGGIAELTGSVETREQQFVAEQIVEAVAGIRIVRNRLVLTGLDSHIPYDATE